MPMLNNTSSGVGMLGPISSLISQIQSDARNWATFGLNVNQQNLDNARWQEVWNYNKNMNNILMNREDTAVQRKAADLAAAGINPMLAGLGGANANAGSIINPSTNMGQLANIPQQDFISPAVAEIQKLQAQSEMQDKDIQAKFLLLSREIANSNFQMKEKIKADRVLEMMKELNQDVIERNRANTSEKIAEYNGNLQWKLQQMRALKDLFKDSEIPLLNNGWQAFINTFDEKEWEQIENGNIGEELISKMEQKLNEFWKKGNKK